MNPTNTNTTTINRKRVSYYLIFNCCFLVVMLTAAFLIQSGQAGFQSYTTVDKQFVETVAASGQQDHAVAALAQTEMARASGFQSIVSMMGLMWMAALAMAVFFVINAYIIFRLRGPASPVRVAVLAGS